MFYTNDKQTKRLDELIRLLMIPDASGSAWFLKQIYFEISKVDSNEFSEITLVFIDKSYQIMFRSIDKNGNEIRR